MESNQLPSDGEELNITGQGSTSGSSSGAGYYNKNGERDWRGERRMLDITRDKPVKVCVRVVVPVRDHPKFNFVGKLLGPKGNSLKRLQEDTLCKMAVLGRGSMKDRQKEEELRLSGDPKFSHLAEDLHVEISAFATPAEAHARIAYALAELRRFLVPDYNDDIRQEQMIEMQILSQQRRTSEESTSEEMLSDRAQPRVDSASSNSTQPAVAPPTPTQPEHREMSPAQHLHHQLSPHTVMVSQNQMLQPAHHIIPQNSILGGDVLGMSGAVVGGGPLGGGVGVVHPGHPALRGVKASAVHSLATQGRCAWAGGRGRDAQAAIAGRRARHHVAN